ncbi:uncharacterized protein TrAtP1_011737 [Trichoderma atroviride]|uniref:uncharacterized protein n=1 Tax=Hypocrea atroviridis TaxID=63577 RepID=UPI0033233E25|nr:hypothetical protein TrAtP1_011737 [Trichoderma atroviride]
MNSSETMQCTLSSHSSDAAKRHIAPDDDVDSHAISKRMCLHPEYTQEEASLPSGKQQKCSSDLVFSINLPAVTTEDANTIQFEDPMDTSGDEMPYSFHEESISITPDCCGSTSATPAAMLATNDGAEPDTCFGAIIATATSSLQYDEGATQVPVTLTAGDTKIIVTSEYDQKYVGIINNTILTRVLREFTLKADAKLIVPEALKKIFSKSSKKLATIVYSPTNYDIRIVLCGFSTDQIAIGNILGDSGFYFQHPSPLEYDSRMQYCNPHYLLRPGTQMPALEAVVEIQGDRRMEQKLLDESTKGRFMKLFDEAGNTDMKATTEPSSRLKSRMKEHQVSALTWMMGVEAGTIRYGFPSLWEPSSVTSTKKYRHKITGSLVVRPELVPGGVLADEMGLGKTLSMLALICSSLDDMECQNSESGEMLPKQSWTTLIVTPKTAIHTWQRQCASHIHHGKIKTAVYLGPGRKRLRDELQSSDIIFTTYETMRRDWVEKGPLFTHSWHRVVLDEAHHIRTRNTQTFEAACEIQAWRRWCLTGTPIHNSIDDFAALLSFVHVPLFMNKKIFDFWITTQIKGKSSYGLVTNRTLDN